jgi:hypothetical protein
MSVTLNTKAYTFDTNPTPDSGRHVGPAQTASVKDYFDLKRTKAKPTATFPGMVRASVKFVRTVTISGESYDAFFEGSIAYPAGTADADVDALRDDAGDFIIASNGGNLFKKHTIVQ